MRLKKKQVYSRKRSALHWLCAAFLLWVLLAQALHLFLVFPRQIIPLAEEEEGIPQATEVLSVLSAPEGAKAQRCYLSANEDAVLLTMARLVPVLGWQLERSLSLDCAKDQALSFGCYFLRHKDDPGQTLGLLVFGCSKDPAVHHLQLCAGTVGPDSLLKLESLTLTPLAELGPETLLSQNGQTYFCFLCTDPKALKLNPDALVLNAYGKNGELCHQQLPDISA